MRVGKGCGRCRHRHIRCVVPEGASACTPCARLGRACHLDPRFQFKEVQHVYQKTQGTAARFDLVWDEDQTWVDVSKPVKFVLELADSPENERDSVFRPIEPAENAAQAVDICDPQCHFATVVPQRALQVPLVLKAVLALAARHDAIMNEKGHWEASAYHGECLELLIDALSLPEPTYDDNMLVAVVILRMYEELDNTQDGKFHLLGSNRLINMMSRSVPSGGLAEAVSWQFMRQAIYSSVVQYQPMQLDLENYRFSSVFQRQDDAAYANMAVFHCAHIIQVCRDWPTLPVNQTGWQEMSKTLESWYKARPNTWQPLRYQPPDVAADRPFPEVWMMSASAVVGMQYYHTACIFLTLCGPNSQSGNDFENARTRRMAERTIATHIANVIGLSLSNESVQNAYFMPCHLLQRFGYCIRNSMEKQGSLKFLAHMEKVIGWQTAWIKRELEQQWTELAEIDPPLGPPFWSIDPAVVRLFFGHAFGALA
ncbi:hypothetical protein N7468_008458 [Penicillium chermesinum]|uniref:Zn(2)-C6 fungal-type domain-containing protein n=1 Tax=Penicillium chermesinum TaxID=63820 RepID=A0A9W9NQ46_9EURO|nr:uncharacterized protein N7468_008458 [Penicillium chermesinum]KAJ5223916.1 hypothetical protein N7468_008458 [Penicillium chermesinum]